MSLNEAFNAAIEKSKKISVRPKDQDLLEMYGYYKQATLGDITASRPDFTDMKARAKWDAWERNKGTSQDDAKTMYIAHIETLSKKYPSN